MVSTGRGVDFTLMRRSAWHIAALLVRLIAATIYISKQPRHLGRRAGLERVQKGDFPVSSHPPRRDNEAMTPPRPNPSHSARGPCLFGDCRRRATHDLSLGHLTIPLCPAHARRMGRKGFAVESKTRGAGTGRA